MVSAPEFDPDSGQAKMGQIWVNSQKKVKTTPEPQGSEVVLSCQFFRKNSTIYTMDTAKLVRYAGSILQKGKRKPQVIKPGVFGKSTARGYNAPCFESVVHNFVGSILMRWDNEDRKDRLSIALAIQNETKHFQVVSSNFQVQY